MSVYLFLIVISVMDAGCEIISKLGSESIINFGSGFQYGYKTTSVSNEQIQSSTNVQILKELFFLRG
jgi:hypothetical protein